MKETKLNQELQFPWEEGAAHEIVSFMRKEMEHAYALGRTPRDFHSKGHSWVRATFKVSDDIDPKFKIGLFKEPKTYQAWIRYSNASNGIHKDIAKDVRGMAIKLFDVPGEKLVVEGEDLGTMDILTFSSPKFLTRSAKQFIGFMRSFLKGNKLRSLWFALLNPGVDLSVFSSFKKTVSLLNINYYSATPYKLGEEMAVKYVVTPDNALRSTIPEHPSDDFLLQNLQEYLAYDDAYFDFKIQPQVNHRTEPIEDGLAVWKSPTYKVATIHIPIQRITTENLVSLAENSSYNPWRTLKEHRPMGNINRVRREVYKQISEFRHQRNNAEIASPNPASVPEEGMNPPKEV